VSEAKLNVAVIGATGIAGQQLLACLAGHPWFKVTALAGSQRSAGKPYAEGIKSANGATGWWADGGVPEEFRGMVIQDSERFDPGSVDLIFSAVEADVARLLEPRYAAVTPVVSAASTPRGGHGHHRGPHAEGLGAAQRREVRAGQPQHQDGRGQGRGAGGRIVEIPGPDLTRARVEGDCTGRSLSGGVLCGSAFLVSSLS